MARTIPERAGGPGFGTPPADYRQSCPELDQRRAHGTRARRATGRPVLPSRLRRPAQGPLDGLGHRAHQPAPPQRGLRAGRGAHPTRRGSAPAGDHRRLQRPDASTVESALLRTRWQYQDARGGARRVRRARRHPEQLRHGIFAGPKTFKAWVRYSGPGPIWSPDIDDIGFLSMAIKLMGVRSQADGRREIHTGSVRDVGADIRHARHARPMRSCRSGAT